MTMKKSMITNTTSIIGAIWKPRLTAEDWVWGRRVFMGVFPVGDGQMFPPGKIR